MFSGWLQQGFAAITWASLSWEPTTANHADANPPLTLESPTLEEESGLVFVTRTIW